MRALFERDPDVVQCYLYDDWMYKACFIEICCIFFFSGNAVLFCVSFSVAQGWLFDGCGFFPMFFMFRISE